MFASFKTPEGHTYEWNDVEDLYWYVNGAPVHFDNDWEAMNAWYATLTEFGCRCTDEEGTYFDAPDHTTGDCPLQEVN